MLGNIGWFIGTTQIEITPPVIYIGERNWFCFSADCRITRTFPIRTPFSETYDEIRIYLEDRLNDVTEQTPIESVLNTYAYLADASERAGCFLKARAQDYHKQSANYRHMVRQWSIVH